MSAGAVVAPSGIGGMGAVCQPGGIAFRVWAPNATAVTLGGDLFHPGVMQPVTWQEFPMARDAAAGPGAAYWSIFMPGGVPDTLYKFKITNPTADTTGITSFWPYRHDPYAKDATAIEFLPAGPGNSVVVDQQFDWSKDKFQTPGWNELVIYELHIGTFNRTSAGVQGNFADAMAKLQYVADLGDKGTERITPDEINLQ
jgi:1,4-alpha-glucan branching enzyme